jgi:hypothetical protein
VPHDYDNLAEMYQSLLEAKIASLLEGFPLAAHEYEKDTERTQDVLFRMTFSAHAAIRILARAKAEGMPRSLLLDTLLSAATQVAHELAEDDTAYGQLETVLELATETARGGRWKQLKKTHKAAKDERRVQESLQQSEFVTLIAVCFMQDRDLGAALKKLRLEVLPYLETDKLQFRRQPANGWTSPTERIEKIRAKCESVEYDPYYCTLAVLRALGFDGEQAKNMAKPALKAINRLSGQPAEDLKREARNEARKGKVPATRH